jgi:two-component system chemotaxis sensor kinase CheA
MNTENYKEAFLEEAVENINNLNRALLSFEKNIGDLTPLNELFRAAHTLKGMSATMGYDKLAEFTHMIEDMMDRIRSGALRPDVDIVNLLFKAIDTMQEFIDNIRSQNVDSASGFKELIALIREKNSSGTGTESVKAVAPAQSGAASASTEKTAENRTLESFTVDNILLDEAARQALKVLRVRVTVAETCSFKSVRAFMVSRNLSEKGEIIKSRPPAKDIEEGNFERSFDMAIATASSVEDIKNSVLMVSEVESAEVEEIKPLEIIKQESIEDKPGAGLEQAEQAGKKQGLSQSVRVNIEKLDALMNLVGELVIAKIRLDQTARNKTYNNLASTVDEFDRIINELQVEVTDVRMFPVSQIFDRYPRIIRDLASQAGKLIEAEISGGDIEIDRTVLEEINEPILHLVRNSVAHGIEDQNERLASGKTAKGLIRLSARRDRNSVIIEVSDDGRGLNLDRIRKKAVEKKLLTEERSFNLSDEELVNFITLPGFSTAEKVDQISGRGVGVDVVKTKVEAFGGIFRIENHPGEGLKSIMKLPLTLAIIQALLVKSSGATYAIPVVHTIETVELPSSELKVIQAKRVIILRDEVVPVLSLAELLDKPAESGKEIVNLVIIEARDKKVALEVDYVIGQQEIAIKSLGEFLKYARGFSGVTILGDGSISLIVDVQSLIETNMKLV